MDNFASCRHPNKPNKFHELHWENYTLTSSHNTQCAVLVHGYKTKVDEIKKIYSNIKDEIKPEITDIIGFTWPSQGKLLKYLTDSRTIKNKKVQKEFIGLIESLKILGYTKIFIISHSIGVQLTMRACSKYLKHGHVDSIVCLAGDSLRYRFNKNRRYGKIATKVFALYNFYSKHDRVLKYISMIVRPFKKVGVSGLPKNAPMKYIDFNTEMITDTKVRHTDYKSNPKILNKIKTLIG